ncbi:MAG: IS4 family transposase [Boseongicola sp.]
MVFHLSQALGRIKNSLALLLDRSLIEHACRQEGHQWRQRLLDPVTTLHLFILQVLHGNTACNHLPHLSDLRFTASAYCQARARLPLQVIRNLLANLCGVLDSETTQADDLWRGHRTFLLDGSSFSMPDTPELQEHFGQPGVQRKGCGFPVAHLLAMFHARTGFLIEALASPLRTHDMKHAAQMHPKLKTGDVLLADRGFCSFAHLALAADRGLQAVFRMHQQVIVNFTPKRPHAERGNRKQSKGLPTSRWLKQLGVCDQLVEWIKPARRPKWMTAEQYVALPDVLEVRELRYRVDRPGFRVNEVTLVTTLLDPTTYPAEALAELYAVRWRVEVQLRDLKQTMKMDVLHCKTVAGVLKELAVFALVYNLIRTVILAAARRQGVSPDRISFIDAVRWLCSARPGKRLDDLIVNPLRPGRIEPRVVKRRPKSYKLLTEPRQTLQDRLQGGSPVT